jgi:aspartate/glutamate racemase
LGKTVFIIHTSSVSVADLNRLFQEMGPKIIVRNIIDDSLLPEVLANGGVTPGVLRRICAYAVAAESAGADLVFNQCSSVGEAADIAAKMIKVPLVKVDEKMAEIACKTGSRIGVVATLPTTMGPTVRLIQRTAVNLGKKVTISQEICKGAFEILISGDRKTHNEMVIKTIRGLTGNVDVVVCAQGSMLALQYDLGETPVPVLMSPPLGVKHAVEVLSTTR